MQFNIAEDLRMIREILCLSQEEMALSIGVSKITIIRIENKETYPSEAVINKIYDFAYIQGIKINLIKEMFYKEELSKHVVFHGAKTIIDGPISLAYGRTNNDFGRGFYCGESSEQAISFISRYPSSSMYIISLDDNDLKQYSFGVNQEWMLAVAYYRGKLDNYKDHPLIKSIASNVESADYIYAPIADNRMFMIIDQFIDGLITDEQCKHCLAATNLGYQYVFLSDKSVSRLNVLERCYISKYEREHYQNVRQSEVTDGDNKVKAAIIKYKNIGNYIEEILR